MSVTLARSDNAGAPAASNDIKVMVVDDSAVVRGLVSRWINAEPNLTVVARHANGKRAVEDITRSAPDVVVLDIEMPVMDGMEALPLILKARPQTKVLMASTLTRRNAEISLRALALGAVDYIPKPDSNSGITTSQSFRRDLLAKIKAVGGGHRSPFGSSSQSALGTGTETHKGIERRGTPLSSRRGGALKGEAKSLGRHTAPTPTPAPAASPALSRRRGDSDIIALRPFSRVPPRVLLFGSSTGGPQALTEVFRDIGPSLKGLPVLVTQHMPATFTTILATHLSEASGLPAKEGDDGEPLLPGHIYVAPGGKHMRVRSLGGRPVITLDEGPEINFCRPAVDPLFETAAAIFGAATLAVVLTGMGNDGAKGALKVADAGGSVIAQDEATSVVWGMPGATAEIGACSALLPLKDIGPKIRQIVRSSRS